MTNEFLLFLKLFTSSARNINVESIDKVDVKKLINISNSQSVFPMIADSLIKLSKCNPGLFPADIVNRMELLELSVINQSAQKNNIIIKALNQLRDSEIEYCLLKGSVYSRFYSNPDLRISSDTDIYVGKDNEKKAYMTLEKLGFETQYRSKTCHHTRCTHPIGGLIELHLSFYDEIFDDLWFDNTETVTEPYITFKDSYGNPISTLGITDGFIFTFLHIVKHFLTEGVGIRQIMDFILYAEYYESKINWERFNETVKSLKFDGFADVCFEIGRQHLASPLARYVTSPTTEKNIVNDFITDIENGGVFGNDDHARKDFYYHYIKARGSEVKNGITYSEYISKWSKQSKLKLLFPSYYDMSYTYKYIRKLPFLLPAAWFHRIIRFLIYKPQKATDSDFTSIIKNTASNEDIQSRLKLINKLRMI